MKWKKRVMSAVLLCAMAVTTLLGQTGHLGNQGSRGTF